MVFAEFGKSSATGRYYCIYSFRSHNKSYACLLPASFSLSSISGSGNRSTPAAAARGLVVSIVPYTLHAAVMQAAIKGHMHVVTTSYISPVLRALDVVARAAGIFVLNQAGLDHLSAVKLIDRVHAKGGKVKKLHLHCGPLPAPECADNHVGYKFSQFLRGGLLVVLALLNPASTFLVAGTDLADLIASAQPRHRKGDVEKKPFRPVVKFRNLDETVLKSVQQGQKASDSDVGEAEPDSDSEEDSEREAVDEEETFAARSAFTFDIDPDINISAPALLDLTVPVVEDTEEEVDWNF
ncbi:Saccharopine dehydrogenase-domain-containing protein [Mycena leptocephala]|nr:Saccharopine dehydrogenase-domain-containing protein [Mycena leptocephala]